jgi:tRNA1(Val) A37 N6-methylase TrmN6
MGDPPQADLAQAGLVQADPVQADPVNVAADAFLGGRLRLRQPGRGHRAGTDAVLLAAAAPLDFDDLALDVGAGVGAAGLALAAIRPRARIGLVEIDPATAAVARQNLALNGMAERGEVFEADVLVPPRRRAAGLIDASAGLVISNPPFLDPRRARSSPDADRRRAHVAPDDGEAGAPFEAWIAAWIAACLALARPGGALILIHRPEALGAILNGVEGRAGAATVLPVHARADAPAIRILVRARKGSRAPLSIAPGLVLHEGARFTPIAEAIHRGDAAIVW